MRARPITATFAILLAAGCYTPPERADAGSVPYDPASGNALSGPISFSDTRVQRVDPASISPIAGACRTPMLGVVDSIVDGDTVHVVVPSEGMEYDVRMIGVDTPETAHVVDGGVTPAECHGVNAYAFTELLRGRTVILTFDQGCLDPFDRLLAYVWIGPGSGDLWQRQLLRRGLARTLSIAPNTGRADTFAADEEAARAASLGLWGACP